jgi:PKD repeat protein
MQNRCRRRTRTTRPDYPPTGRARGLGVLVLLISLSGGFVGAAASAPSAGAGAPACRQLRAPAGISGIVADRSTSGCTSVVRAGASAPALDPLVTGNAGGYSGGDPPLVNQGGPAVGANGVPGANTVHAIYWAGAGTPVAFAPGYEAGVNKYFDDVAAASGTPSNVYALATQYTDGQLAGSPHLHYAVRTAAPVSAGDAYPSSGGCTPDSGHGESYSACITDAQIHTELASLQSKDSLPTGLGDIYVVLFPPGVETCFDSTDAAAGGTCSDTAYTGFCAYHSGVVTGSGISLYADIPYPTGFGDTCLGTEDPNGSIPLDSTLSMISHEHMETITDPEGNAWRDSLGNEIGDECAWNFGPQSGPSGARWNQTIGPDHYELQQEFSNEDFALDTAAGCAQTQAVPTASFAVTTVRPVPGTPVAVDGTASSVANVANGITAWSWTFGDGGSATGATTTHVYAAPGDYTVTLTVTDTDGFTGSVSHVEAIGTGVAPVFTSGTPPGSVSAGAPYRFTFIAGGNPTPTYGLAGAPGWLGIDSVSGALSGTPPAGTTSFTYSVTASNGVDPSATAGPFTVAVDASAPTPSPPPAPSPVPGDGYWLVGSDGGIFAFGSAGFHGSTGGIRLQRPVLGISPTSDRQGYWLVASDGGVFAFGDAGFYGSLPGLGFSPSGSGGRSALAAPIVAMVPSTDDDGYFMVASDGGVFAFGDARFAGSCPGIGGCAGTAVAVMPDASGGGYWLVTSTGSVYAFGDAAYLGSPAPRPVAVTSAVRTPDGGGYWVLYADGRLSPFGDAGHFGDPAGALGPDRATAVFATTDGGGYWVATAAGSVFNFGDAPADGSMAGTRLNAPVIAASGW